MMTHLIKLELRKNSMGRYGALAALLILASMIFVTVSLVDSATDPTQTKDTFDNAFRMVELFLSCSFIIFYGALVSAMILKEYNTRTILILFSYPVNRKKLIGAKLLVISVFILLSLLAAYLLCCGYIVGADCFFDLLEGSAATPLLLGWIARVAASCGMCVCMGLLAFCAGMVNKSVSTTIIGSIVLIFIRQVALTSAYGYTENLLQSLLVIFFTMICVWYTLAHKVERAEA